jgi:wyosine [tRNA(Phe)-imidazoG37] synthetase (radical SAM superfamily)
LSIGVNLNPDKVCNFDCIYCCVDRSTMPGRVEVDLDVLRSELRQMVELARSGEIWRGMPFDRTPEPLKRLNDVAFSGDGEPTSFPEFLEACRIVSDALREAGLERRVKVVVITNATLFHQPRVQQALRFLDEHNGELWAKLDAGTEDYYRLVERTSIPLQRVLDNLLLAARDRPIVIQTLFMHVHGQPPTDAEIDAYIGRLNELVRQGGKVKLVQIYTIARDTAVEYVAPLNAAQIDAISERVRQQTGLTVETYYGPA